MVNTNFMMGVAAALFGIGCVEGILLYLSYRKNRQIEVSKIEEDAHEIVQTMSDDDLRKQLEDELKPR